MHSDSRGLSLRTTPFIGNQNLHPRGWIGVSVCLMAVAVAVGSGCSLKQEMEYRTEVKRLAGHYQQLVTLRNKKAGEAEMTKFAKTVRAVYGARRTRLRTEVKPGDKAGKHILWAMDEMTRMSVQNRVPDQQFAGAEHAFRSFLSTAAKELGMTIQLPPPATDLPKNEDDDPNTEPAENR